MSLVVSPGLGNVTEFDMEGQAIGQFRRADGVARFPPAEWADAGHGGGNEVYRT